MNERFDFKPDLVDVETEVWESHEQPPPGFDAGELQRMRNEEIGHYREELGDVQEGIKGYYKNLSHKNKSPGQKYNEQLYIVGYWPPEPKTIEAIALINAGGPVKLKGIGTSTPESNGIEQWATTGPSKNILFVMTTPEEAESIQKIQKYAATQHPVGVLLSNTIGRQRTKWQASDLGKSEGTKHIRNISPQILRISCHEVIDNGTMARLFLTQEVLDSEENSRWPKDHVSTMEEMRSYLKSGKLPQEEADEVTAYLRRQYMDYWLRQDRVEKGQKVEGYRPFTVKELIDLQTGVYEKVKQELYGSDDYDNLAPVNTSY